MTQGSERNFGFLQISGKKAVRPVPAAGRKVLAPAPTDRTSGACRYVPLLSSLSTTTLADLSKDRCLFASDYAQLLAFPVSEIRESPLG
jgi:hypothetical protein